MLNYRTINRSTIVQFHPIAFTQIRRYSLRNLLNTLKFNERFRAARASSTGAMRPDAANISNKAGGDVDRLRATGCQIENDAVFALLR